MAVSVVCLTTIGTTEADPRVRVDDPIGPKLIRWVGDGRYGVGKIPFFHGMLRRSIGKSDPGAYGFMLARLRYMDDIVRQEGARGLKQLVVLGAGLDTRAYRMGAELADVEVFEVDLPSTSQEKQARLRRAVDSIPENVTYVEMDFNREALPERLAEAGFDGSALTLFVLSGVSMYLPEKAVLELFEYISRYRGSGSSIVFDHFSEKMIKAPGNYRGGQAWADRACKAGEKPMYGIEMEDVPELLEMYGLQLISHRSMGDLAEDYLRRQDDSLVEEPYDFAAVAHARVGGVG
jgi:methyltransferase (TIGR00027 family)